MRFDLMVQSYDTHGGHATLTLVGRYLERALSGSEVGLSAVEATACFRTERRARATLEEMHARFHQQLATLPTARFEGKRGRLTLRYASGLGLAEDVLKNRVVDAGLFRRALGELVDVVRSLEPKLSGTPGLDYQALLEGLGRALASAPATEAELVALEEQYRREAVEAYGKLPWWEQLEVEWDEYHPKARELLNDRFFWDCTNDNAPHGNDTGADLLAEYPRWRRTHRALPASDFLDWLLRQWGMPGLRQWKRKLNGPTPPEDLQALLVYDEAILALAFALLKLEGECDPKIVQLALEAIERQKSPALMEGWADASERAAALGKMERTLRGL